MPRSWVSFLSSSLCVCLIGASVRASYPEPFWSFQERSPDGEFLFVMVGEKGPSPIGGFIEPKESQDIRLAYPRTGLYPASGPKAPVWTADLLCYQKELYLVSDNVHMILRHYRDSKVDHVGLVFYENGNVLRSYRVEELAGKSYSKWLADEQFDDIKLEYQLTVNNGKHFVFDIATGAVVSELSRTRYWLLLFSWAGIIFALTVSLYVCLKWLLRMRRRGQAIPYPTNTGKAGE
jgi:hypothetical protein